MASADSSKRLAPPSATQPVKMSVLAVRSQVFTVVTTTSAPEYGSFSSTPCCLPLSPLGARVLEFGTHPRLRL
ncbi:unnamed protein product [Nippostrongylus brasiliensis]|uniref:Uncharacterized protein n=1 Tax=Nippostrongylus brasiliensis TaxID=27835 RepID=A0A0N4XI59_NIPBR|nr:unnamed protein product [Nippostrongylus brasiliensis]